jgi:hypothetical protein
MTIEVEGTTTRGSSAILLRLVIKILLDWNSNAEVTGIMIGAWNAWIQCLVNDDTNEYPFDGQQGMSASTMEKYISSHDCKFHFVLNWLKKRGKLVVLMWTQIGTDIKNLLKYQLYHYLLKLFFYRIIMAIKRDYCNRI